MPGDLDEDPLETELLANLYFGAVDGIHGVRHTRYIRIEYDPPFLHAGWYAIVPREGERGRICGEVKWDTDDEGWYEIHPHHPAAITKL